MTDGPIFQPTLAGNPANDAREVTPSNSVDLPHGPCRAIYVGTAGDVKLITAGGTTVTFVTVPAGVLPVRAARIFATGTTAGNIVALY